MARLTMARRPRAETGASRSREAAHFQIKEGTNMEHTQEVRAPAYAGGTAPHAQRLCDYRARLGNLMGQMAGMGLSTAEAQMLSNQLGGNRSPAAQP